ncbi:MAG: PKD domain-containing protein [Halobacteriales archaeon]|nr:PKD domain-containing protein [Halobacteriales archaeon]
MRAAITLAALFVAVSLSGCLGVDNMPQFKQALGFQPEPLKVLDPVARIRASPTLVAVGLPVAFSAQGSHDPQGLPLVFTWDFGDGAHAVGSAATHAFRSAGSFTVTLGAANPAGARGTDTLLLTVTDNQPPAVTIAVLQQGQPATRGLAGGELTFQAQVADPEGQPTSLRWDFADGSTSLTTTAQHAFQHGGRYLVTLTATDAQGASGIGQLPFAVDESLGAQQGQVALLAQEEQGFPLTVRDGPSEVTARVSFDGALGLNGVEVRLLDPAGNVVAKQPAGPSPGAQGALQGVLRADASVLSGHSPGTWSLVVARTSGAQVPFQLDALVRY